MLFIFPLVYISSFILALAGIFTRKKQEVLIFLIFGLSIYITALSVAFSMGLRSYITILQGFKEILIVTLLGVQIWTLKKKPHFHFIDYGVMAFFGYTFLYALLPIGEQGLVQRLLAFKSVSFFPLVYFCGRLMDLRSIYLSKYFHYILYLSIAAAGVVLFEYVTYQHLQTRTGYADYNYYLYSFEPTGSFGLTFTFEAEGGLKRFASFFANPLEHAAATLLALAVIAGLFTSDENKFKLSPFGIVALIATQICIVLALSRSSFLSYFVMIYVYAIKTRKKQILHAIHFAGLAGVVYFLFLLNNKDIQEFVITTLNFTNPSSVGHLIEWIEGINAMIHYPLGLGLGSSGRIGGSLGENTGGENQLIIIGVQAGVIASAIYLAIYVSIVKNCWKWFNHLKGKEKHLCTTLLLMKIGFIIPMFTSELESSLYISYMTWFFSGIFVHMISEHLRKKGLEVRKGLVKQEILLN